MTLHFTYPWALWAGLAALLPLLFHGVRSFDSPGIADWGDDAGSRWIRIALRTTASLAMLLLAAGAAAPFIEGGTVVTRGTGAEIAIVFDRSGSMSEPLIGEHEDKDAGEPKIAAARRTLLEFMRKRQGDTFGMVAFNSSPIVVAPLSEDREIVEAALLAAESRSLGYTALGRALGLGLEFFRERPMTASRVVLLVSDGGAVIREDNQESLRRLFRGHRASLIWIYTRGSREPSVIDPPPGRLSDSLSMHRFFGSLDVDYQVFEVTSREGLDRAIAEVGRLTNLPTQYRQRLPRRDLAPAVFAGAAFLIVALVVAKMMEVRAWPA